jgi:glycine cleavage system aminomethyltransferase T
MAKQSALHHWAEETGAVLTMHQGWQTPARFGEAREEAARVTQSVGLADVSWITKFDLKGNGVETLPALGEGVSSWKLGPCHLLVTCDPATRPSFPSDVIATDVTSVFAQFLLAGPCAREILAKLSSLNVSEHALPDGGCAQTSFAHTHAIVLRQNLGALAALHLLVARDYGEFVWEAVLHAGHEFHLAPFGLEALRELGHAILP